MADKTYQWLKLWHDARNDAKLNALTDRQYRIWHRLLIFASEQADNRGAIIGLDDELIAVEVAFGDDEAFAETVERLVKLRMLERLPDGYRFTHFESRQEDHRKPSDAPEATRERQRDSRARKRDGEDVTPLSRDVTPLSRDVTPLSRDVTRQEEDVDAEEDAEPEGESPPPPSASGEDIRQRQQRARAHTHEEPPPADAHPADASPPARMADVAAPAASMRASPTPRQERLPDDEFVRQFADAADLPAAARGQALDAIIAEYRPRAPDGVLIVEAYSFREYYPKRPRSNRLLANWMATWWARRQVTVTAAAAQQQREEAPSGQRQHQQQPAAVASARFSGARRRFDPPDPTRNGVYTHRVRDSSDFPDEDD